jgi:hypothetical protein
MHDDDDDDGDHGDGDDGEGDGEGDGDGDDDLFDFSCSHGSHIPVAIGRHLAAGGKVECNLTRFLRHVHTMDKTQAFTLGTCKY